MKTKAPAHNIKVGDRFVSSWGYDQTNIDFFEVVEVTASSVYVREIAKVAVPNTQGFMSQYVRPMDATREDRFLGRGTRTGEGNKPKLYRVAGDRFRVASYATARLIKGEDKFYESWYA